MGHSGSGTKWLIHQHQCLKASMGIWDKSKFSNYCCKMAAKMGAQQQEGQDHATKSGFIHGNCDIIHWILGICTWVPHRHIQSYSPWKSCQRNRTRDLGLCRAAGSQPWTPWISLCFDLFPSTPLSPWCLSPSPFACREDIGEDAKLSRWEFIATMNHRFEDYVCYFWGQIVNICYQNHAHWNSPGGWHSV